MSEPWHQYVFDAQRRRFVGDFESMYRAEEAQAFDSWKQDDLDALEPQICAFLLRTIPFRTALDLGCGKGAFTSTLIPPAAHVVGVDGSDTAIAVARHRYPKLDWVSAPVMEYLAGSGPFDLIVAKQLLSYVENWPALLESIAERCQYCLVTLYLPPNPIGFVKSHSQLDAELDRRFRRLETVRLETRSIAVHLLEGTAQPARTRSVRP